MAALPIALQLYTVRDHMEKDPVGTLKSVKDMGFDHVEPAGFVGKDAAGFKALLDDVGLAPTSGHWGTELIFGDLDQVMKEAEIMGVRYVVVPWLGGEVCSTEDAWRTAIDSMDKAGARLQTAGLQLCYHNHDHEFQRFGDQTIFDMIYANTDPKNLAMELDTCWAAIGGEDVPALIARYAGRIPLLHVKDYRPETPPVLTELGRGCMDWDAVLPAGQKAGAEWFIAEQDTWEMDAIDSAAISAKFIAQWKPKA
jgi:sugar phosphate isomerase/epimerase